MSTSSPAAPTVAAPFIALVGNPNTGKSTIFNRLTGLKQRIANYPGITVEARRGEYALGGQKFEVVDLPGAYSLAATSPDERVVIDSLTGQSGYRRPDVVVCVVDATNLRRNLFLAAQLAEFEMPMVLVLNQWDVALKQGTAIEPKALEDELGVPVLTTNGRSGEGLEKLREAISNSLDHPRFMARTKWRPEVEVAANELRSSLKPLGDELGLAEAHRLIFDTNCALRERLVAPQEAVDSAVQKARTQVRRAGLNPAAAEALSHYGHLDSELGHVLKASRAQLRAGDESIDALLVHRVWGSIIFIAVMWVVFQSVYAWAGPFMDLIDSLTGSLMETISPMLAGTPVFQSLVVDGVIAGVGGVIIFLPQIFILFLFIALLEESGYMSRAAFLMDKLFGWCGLNGKSFVPLLSSYACAIPGVMAARSLEDPKARLTTVLLAPFMSCSARLPVYVLLIGAFIEPIYGTFAAGWTLFAMHFIGLVVALPIVWFLNRIVLRTTPLPFMLEMSSYKIPDMRNVLTKMWEGGREFIVRAGTVILAFSIIIWALLYFPRPQSLEAEVEKTFVERQAAEQGVSVAAIQAQLEQEDSQLAVQLGNTVDGAYLEQSYLGRFGKTVQPIFAPAGFDWKITVGIISSFPAREVIIATLGIIYNLGPEDDEESGSLRDTMAAETWSSGPRAGEQVFTVPVVFAIMVFFALCMQCGATVAVIAKQIGWGWAAGSFFGMTAVAWLAAVIVYQVGSLFA